MDGLSPDAGRRYRIEGHDTEGNRSDIQVDSGQISICVEILLTMSHNAFTTAEEHIQ